MNKFVKLCLLGLFFITLQSAGCKKDEEEPVVSSMIGKSGPGGGIVYYDKGYYSGGWRYIEVSTVDFPAAKWGKDGIFVYANEFPVGEGDRNNQRLLDSCLIPGEIIAAQHAANYVNNGYSDWYLPTTGDYAKMYENLYLHGIGSFQDAASYWTSCEGCNDVTGAAYHFGFNFDATVSRWEYRKSRAVRRF